MNLSTPFSHVSECNWKNINGLLPLLDKALSVWAFLQRCLDKFEQPSVNFFFFHIYRFTHNLGVDNKLLATGKTADKDTLQSVFTFTEERIRPYIELKLFR